MVQINWLGGPYSGTVVPALKQVSDRLSGSLQEDAYDWKTEEVGLPAALQNKDQFNGGDYSWLLPNDLPTG